MPGVLFVFRRGTAQESTNRFDTTCITSSYTPHCLYTTLYHTPCVINTTYQNKTTTFTTPTKTDPTSPHRTPKQDHHSHTTHGHNTNTTMPKGRQQKNEKAPSLGQTRGRPKKMNVSAPDVLPITPEPARDRVFFVELVRSKQVEKPGQSKFATFAKLPFLIPECATPGDTIDRSSFITQLVYCTADIAKCITENSSARVSTLPKLFEHRRAMVLQGHVHKILDWATPVGNDVIAIPSTMATPDNTLKMYFQTTSTPPTAVAADIAVSSTNDSSPAKDPLEKKRDPSFIKKPKGVDKMGTKRACGSASTHQHAKGPYASRLRSASREKKQDKLVTPLESIVHEEEAHRKKDTPDSPQESIVADLIVSPPEDCDPIVHPLGDCNLTVHPLEGCGEEEHEECGMHIEEDSSNEHVPHQEPSPKNTCDQMNISSITN